MTLYLKVTKDKYELPVAVADSKKELARMVGCDASGIYRAFAGGRKSCYVEVEVEDDEYLCSGKKYKAALPNAEHDLACACR